MPLIAALWRTVDRKTAVLDRTGEKHGKSVLLRQQAASCVQSTEKKKKKKKSIPSGIR